MTGQETLGVVELTVLLVNIVVPTELLRVVLVPLTEALPLEILSVPGDTVVPLDPLDVTVVEEFRELLGVERVKVVQPMSSLKGRESHA